MPLPRTLSPHTSSGEHMTFGWLFLNLLSLLALVAILTFLARKGN